MSENIKATAISSHLYYETTIPLVSIICNTYQHKEFILDAINSFLVQETKFPVEILIHDDASTDGTAEIIQEYADRYPNLIKPILQTVNKYSQGIKINPNFQYPRAKGKYIAICEGDDYWNDPKKLQVQVDFLENNPEYMISGHDAIIVDEEGKTLVNSKLPDRHKRDYSAEELILKKAFILTLSWVFRNVVKEFPYELRMVGNGDTFMTSIFGEYGKSKYHTDIKPGVYRVHKGGVWSLKSDIDKIDSHINTYYWMYRYYFRSKKNEYAKHFWNKFLVEIYNKLTLINEMNPELMDYTELDTEHIKNQTHSLLREQVNIIKKLEYRLKSQEKVYLDLKKSLSYRLGNAFIRPFQFISQKLK